MKHRSLIFYSWFIRIILFFLPDIPFIMRIRGFLYGIVMNECGFDFQVTHDAVLKCLENISIGNNVFIGNNSMLMGSGKIMIEDQVMLGPFVVCISGSHTRDEFSFRFGKSRPGEILLKKGSWVCSHCTVSSGAILPEGSVLGANSFLNSDFVQKNKIFGGVPAKLIN